MKQYKNLTGVKNSSFSTNFSSLLPKIRFNFYSQKPLVVEITKQNIANAKQNGKNNKTISDV